jgi:SAM-dependent methyltransferase
VLQRSLPACGDLLELSSGTGQHAVHFARHLPQWRIHPSDVDPANLASIEAWRSEAGLPNLLAPLALDVSAPDWGVTRADAIFNANLIHIAPWAVALGLFRGCGQHLATGGVFVLYGPFRIGGAHTAPSNESFDESLRSRDASFGVRDLEAVVAVAEQQGLRLRERVEMPANNQTLIFRRV